MSYPVKLEVFEGPLDLLLQLVSKDRVDISEVSISTITDEYLQAVKSLEELDLDMASSFLVLAATLLELKSLRLLPRRTIDDPELAALLEERDHLLHRLVEYSTFKNASATLVALFKLNEGFVPRQAEIPEELQPAMPDIMEGITAVKLAAAAAKALAPKPDVVVDVSHVTPIRVSVREMIDLLLEQISALGSVRFSELRAQAGGRIEVIVRFLAILEMFKRQQVEMEQQAPFEEIVIRYRQPQLGSG